MATIITNQATLNYKFGTVSASTTSNITSAVLGGSIDVSKTALTENYRLGENITYVINIKNNGNQTGDITFTDNLGSYTLNGNQITPLTYIGNAQLFINGMLSQGLTVVANNDEVNFAIANLPANATAQIIYEARVNEFAPLECGSVITNRIESECECICGGSADANHSITADCYADVRIVKSVCPNPIICGEEVTYIFDIYNYGNIPATDVVLTDVFTPPLTDITVSVNGNIIPATDYSYVNGNLRIPALNSSFELTVPAATFTQNPQTGLTTITPGHLQITVTGTIA